MRLQTLLESTGQVWAVLLDTNDRCFDAGEVFSALELFSTESAAVDRIFEHIERQLEDEEDQLAEIEKLKKRTKTVAATLELLETSPGLALLDSVITAKKMVVN